MLAMPKIWRDLKLHNSPVFVVWWIWWISGCPMFMTKLRYFAKKPIASSGWLLYIPSQCERSTCLKLTSWFTYLLRAKYHVLLIRSNPLASTCSQTILGLWAFPSFSDDTPLNFAVMSWIFMQLALHEFPFVKPGLVKTRAVELGVHFDSRLSLYGSASHKK